MTPKSIKWSQVRHHWEVYLFIVPTLVLIGLFQYYPAASGVFHSFFRWNGADISEWVGLDNYADLLKSSEFWNSFKIAFILGAWNIVKMIPALVVAVCIHRCRSMKLQFLYRTLFVIPMVIPGLVVALIWRSFFFEATNGYLNKFLLSSGLFDVLSRLDQWLGWGGVFSVERLPAWLGDPRLILVACIVWGFPWVGSFAVLTHLAKLQGISKDVYEAGEIDGINWWTKFTKIELPLIMGSIYLLLVFVIIDTVKDAGMILALAGLEGGPGGEVTVPALFMIRKAFLEQKMGYACAVGIILTAVVMLLQKLSTAVMGASGWKPHWRFVMRWAGFMAGVGMLVAGVLRPLGAGLALVLFPWGALRERCAGLLERFHREESGAALDARLKRELERRLSPGYRRAQAVGRFCLRGARHATIWGVLAFAFLPLYLMLIVSLKDNPQFYEAPAVMTQPYHWTNWQTAWDMVMPTVANSLFVAISSTCVTLVFALCAAYFFARVRMPMSGLLWNAILVLMMMPAIANLIPLFRLLRDMDMLNTLLALILVGISGGQVFAIFVLRNFVADIPQDLFEAAEIDGAGHLQQMRQVVLPLSGPILGTVGVMHFISMWNDFVLPLIVMRDHARLPVMVQLLRLAGEYVRLWGPLMAGYAIACVPVIILFVFSMKLFVRGLTEGAVKG